MSNCYENERQKRREQYLLASKNPWLLWRLEVYKAGYIPPLVMGKIPPELAKIPLGKKREEYDVEPLIRHAEHVRETERSFVKRAFTTMLITMLLLIALSVTYAVKTGNHFQIGFLDAILHPSQKQAAGHVNVR